MEIIGDETNKDKVQLYLVGFHARAHVECVLVLHEVHKKGEVAGDISSPWLKQMDLFVLGVHSKA